MKLFLQNSSLFIENKYYRTYLKIIERSIELKRIKKSFDGLEYHHILPKSIGGNNKKSNLTLLTCKEHFIAHRLLMKFTNGNDKRLMVCAWIMMSGKSKYNSKNYEDSRKHAAIAIGGDQNPFWGKTHSEEARLKMSISKIGNTCAKGSIRSDLTKRNISKSLSGRSRPDISKAMTGRKLTPEHIANVIKSRSNYRPSEITKEKIRQAAFRQWERQKLSLDKTDHNIKNDNIEVNTPPVVATMGQT